MVAYGAAWRLEMSAGAFAGAARVVPARAASVVTKAEDWNFMMDTETASGYGVGVLKVYCLPEVKKKSTRPNDCRKEMEKEEQMR